MSEITKGHGVPTVPEPLEAITATRNVRAILDAAIARMTPDAKMEDVAAILMWLDHVAKMIREARESAELAGMEWIKEQGRDIEQLPTRWFISTPKDTKCEDIPKAAEALLAATGGDFEAFCRTMVSQPFKHGYCKTILTPEVYDKLFATTTREKLEEGKPAKLKLTKVNEDFLPKRS